MLRAIACVPPVISEDGSFETLTGTVTAVSGSDIVGAGNTVTRNVTVSVENPGGLGDRKSTRLNSSHWS